MKVLFSTNFPSPYRVDFFNEFGKYCDLTVAFERKKALHRDNKWVGSSAVNYKEIYLNSRPIGTSQTIGFELVSCISKNKFDIIIFSGYASPSVIIAIEYCKITKRKYYIEYDGGFEKKDSFFKGMLKKHLIRGAKGHFVTCSDTEEYLKGFNVSRQNIFYYPFSSLFKNDIMCSPISNEEKRQKKEQLGISEQLAMVSVGRFIKGKGFDELLTSLDCVDRSVGVYIIGGEPTEEYLQICNKYELNNVHFMPFLEKKDLFEWYKACDLFVFPTRKDIWGLVVNEAMACGLPVISSNMCIAAKELVKPEVNGLLYESGCVDQLSECINRMLIEDLYVYSMNSLTTIKDYTIENMAKAHAEVLGLSF